MCQEQPLLLEDLLEQEKREQERQHATSAVQQQQVDGGQSLLSEHDYERLRADVFNTAPQGLPAQGMLPLQQQQPQPPQPGGGMAQHSVAVRQKFLARGVNQNQWRPTMTLHSQLMGQQTPQPSGILPASGETTSIGKNGYVYI